MRQKVLFIVGSVTECGGTERMANIIANGINQVDQYDVHILVMNGEPKPYFEYDDSIHIHALKKKRGLLSSITSLRSLFKVLKPNMVIDVETGLALVTIPALLGLGIRHIGWEHFNFNVNVGTWTRDFARQLSAIFCDDIVTLTERDAHIWQKKTLNIAKIQAIPNPAPSRSVTKKSNNKTFLSVGRLSNQKGFDLLLKAWSIVKEQDRDYSLTIVGSGGEQENLTILINELDIQDSVEIQPFTKNIDSYYSEASIYVMSSRFEGFGMVLLEAASHSIPLVSFDCDMGPREIITPSSGWLAEPESPEALAQAMLKAIEALEDDETYQQYSESSYSQSKNYSIDMVLQKWMKLINEK
jgi:glycosyltransferase involved in cell wall biosynthesis